MNRIGVFIVVCFLYSCSGKKIENIAIHSISEAYDAYGKLSYEDLTKRELNGQSLAPEVLSFDPRKVFKEPCTLAVVDSAVLIPLETTDACLIVGIKKVICKNDLFYIWDMKRENLFIFDAKGRFKVKIGSQGRGSEEYRELTDFAVFDNGDVFVVDNVVRKVLVYDSAGLFQKSIPVKNDYISAVCVGGQIVLTTRSMASRKDQAYRIEIIDTMGGAPVYYFPYDASQESNQLNFCNLGIQVTPDRNFLYFPQLGMQAYLIGNDGKLQKNYLFDLKDLSTPPWLTVGAKNSNIGVEGINKIRMENCMIRQVFDLENYVCADIACGLLAFSIKNKRTGHCELISTYNADNARTWPNAAFSATAFVGAMENNILIGCGLMNTLKMQQEIEAPDNFSFGPYNQLIQDAKADENPVLILVKVKTSDEKKSGKWLE